MKALCLVIVLLAQTVAAQNTTEQKPCIAFSPESTSPTDAFAKDPLESAVMLSGDFVFYTRPHEGCWNVHVLSMQVATATGKNMGYVISHTVTDPQNVEVGHALIFGPDRDIFLQAMRKAAADTIRNVRLVRGISSPAQ